MRKGFTLLELLIVVVILGVLALIAAPTLLNAADKAKDAAVQGNVSAAATSVTSQFALDSSQTYSTMITNVVSDLNDTNTNPIDDAVDAFASSGTCSSSVKGQVILTSDSDSITITGCGIDGTAVITKTIQDPSVASST